MPYNPHGIVKPQAVADTFVEAVAERLVIANTFSRFDAGEYLGKANDTLTKRVRGSLPFRRWGFRNDRREPLKVDKIEETTVNMTVGAEWLYSGTELTPEQLVYDFNGQFGDVINDQIDAIVQGFEYDAYGLLESAPYERVKVLDNTRANVLSAKEIGQDHLFNQFVDLKRDLKRMRTPSDSFVAVAGSGIIAELTKANKLVRSSSLGESAFATATVGTYNGITFIEGPAIMPDNVAYMYDTTGYLLWNAAPPIPVGGNGNYAQSNKDGVSMLWIQDHDNHYMVNRSIFATWTAQNYAKDYIKLEDGAGRRVLSESDYFLKGVKIVLDGDPLVDEKKPGDGKSDTPGGATNSMLAKAFRGELATPAALEGELMPLWLRQGATNGNDVVSTTTNADGTTTTTYSDGSTTTA